MFDAGGAENFFENIHRLWIEPELKKRWPNGHPEDFRVRRCLIRFPAAGDPIVEFNDEIRWIARVKVVEGVTAREGDDIFLRDIDHVSAVHPPDIDGKPVGFIFLYLSDQRYSIIFDLTPGASDIESPATIDEWVFGKHISNFLQTSLVDRAVAISAQSSSQLAQIGLWPVPCLMPNPQSQIVHLLETGDADRARQLLVQHCTASFLENRVQHWGTVPAFQIRMPLFEQALRAHRDTSYALPIYTLLPQVEGVVTDWLLAKIPEADVPFRQESKTKKFREIVEGGMMTATSSKKIVKSVTDFILYGPVLKIFEQWTGAVDIAFPGRHVVGHGRYEPAFVTEENSIKVFLLIDTLWCLMRYA